MLSSDKNNTYELKFSIVCGLMVNAKVMKDTARIWTNVNDFGVWTLSPRRFVDL